MSVTGLFIGWRLHEGVVNALIGYGLLLLFGFAMIWIGILVGSAMRSVEAVNGLMFTTIFPVTFLANTFAPTEAMAPVLRTIAEWNPISSLVQAMRELWGNEIAMIFQDPMTALNPVMKIGKQITESLRFHLDMGKQDAKETAVALLRAVSPPDDAEADHPRPSDRAER